MVASVCLFSKGHTYSVDLCTAISFIGMAVFTLFMSTLFFVPWWRCLGIGLNRRRLVEKAVQVLHTLIVQGLLLVNLKSSTTVLIVLRGFLVYKMTEIGVVDRYIEIIPLETKPFIFNVLAYLRDVIYFSSKYHS